MSEVTEILEHIEEGRKFLNSQMRTLSDKWSGQLPPNGVEEEVRQYTNLAITLNESTALLSSHAVIDKDQAGVFNDFCYDAKEDYGLEQEDLVTAEQNWNYMQSELSRLTAKE